jgi:insulysin
MVKIHGAVKQPSGDKNKYRALELDNGLTVYLVQDETAEKSAACMQVEVGSLRDPREYMGLAHFLEHMLFCGSEKYPGEGDYMKFLGQNGGETNAWTSTFDTVYYFDIANGKFLEALDQFAQFFISPLLLDSSVLKEVNAVNSEAEMNLNNDYRREYSVTRLLSDPKSEYFKYSSGNLDTLGDLRGHFVLESDKLNKSKEEVKMSPEAILRKDNLVAALKKFYKEYYSANKMVLAIQSNKDLDTMQKFVEELFSQVPNTNPVHTPYSQMIFPYPPVQMGKMVKIIPVNRMYKLSVYFNYEHQLGDILNKNYHYLSHLIGHESKGSALDLLVKEGLATGLTASLDNEMDYFCQLAITIDLTERGYEAENVKRVISVLGAYINMMKEEGPQEWIYQELRTAKELRFKFKSGEGSCSNVITLSTQHQEYKDPVNVLYNPYRYDTFKPELIKQLFGYLQPSNMHVIISSDKIVETEADPFLTDPYYKSKYHVSNLSAELIEAFTKGDLSWKTTDATIHLPERNTMLPTCFDIKENPKNGSSPQILKEAENSTLWHWQDNLFLLPKASCRARIYTDWKLTRSSAKQEVIMKLWESFFEMQSRSMAYMAAKAEVHGNIQISQFGVEISVSCFDESLKSFLEKYCDAIHESTVSEFTEERFNQFRDEYIRTQTKVKNGVPTRYLLGQTDSILKENCYSIDEKIKAAETVTWEETKQLIKRMFSRTRFEWLIEGNLTEKEALDISQVFEKKFTGYFQCSTLPKNQVYEARAVKLSKNKPALYEMYSELPTEKNNCFAKYFELRDGDRDVLPMKVFDNWISSDYFETLRTQQQLGYIVRAGYSDPRASVVYYRFIIQSDVKSGHFCQNRTNVFLKEKLDELEKMTPDSFKLILDGVKANLQEPDKSLDQRFDFDSENIFKHHYKFDEKKQQLAQLELFTKDDLMSFFKRTILEEGCSIEFHLYSHATKEENKKEAQARAKEEKVEVFRSAKLFRQSYELHADKTSILDK